MDKCKILVVTHKDFDCTIVPKEGYQVIKVGNSIPSEVVKQKGFISDDEGINISNENPWYCELTGQYWGWKNLTDVDAHYIGLCHYRRYFFDYKKGSKKFSDDILTSERIAEILKNHKAIMSFKTVKYPGYGKLYSDKPKTSQDKHWVIMEEIFERDYNYLMPSFKKVLYGKYTIWGNMLITTKDIFDEYSEWLFEILKKYDIEIEKRGEKRIPRVDGFLSEYLLLIWFDHKFNKRDIYHLEVRNTETDSFEDYKGGIKGNIVKFLRSNYWMLYISRYIRIGYLLYKRR